MVKKTFNKLDVSGGVRFDTRHFSNTGLFTKPDAITGFDRAVTGADTVGANKAFSDYHHTFSGVSGSHWRYI